MFHEPMLLHVRFYLALKQAIVTEEPGTQQDDAGQQVQPPPPWLHVARLTHSFLAATTPTVVQL
jgi:hypothetical protein